MAVVEGGPMLPYRPIGREPRPRNERLGRSRLHTKAVGLMTYQPRRNFRRTRMSVRNNFAPCLQHADFAVDDAPVPKPFYPKHGLRP